MKDINPDFFYTVELDDECKFKSAVWVDARCRASYEYYGDVVSVDSTYRRNRHGLPFVSFVGVNHHGRSTLLGCALLGNEEIASYEWVFSQWVKCMGTAPQCIITDQCRFKYHAIKNTLPDTRHRWYIWHIMNKLPSKLGGYRRYGALYVDLNNIVWNSRTEESFEDNWADFIDEYNLHNNTWVSDLYDDRRMWIPIYFKGEFWSAMRSTQRSESMHAFYGGYLHSKTSLVQFVHEYDNVLGFKEQRELEDDAADSDVQIEFVKKANCRVSTVDKQGSLVCVTMEEEKLVNDTILCVSYDVHFDHSTQEKVPSCYVLPRWSKKIKRKHTYVKSSHDISRSDESHVAFKGLCAHFYSVAQEFVGDDEETTLPHVALEETMAKLAAHHAKKRSESVSKTQTNIGS
ncbi:hypothetical protein Ahy_A02g006763 isoform E [Arachis hypogaea]|uniref:MULE transposase domain-containing protein n=1 Tax=Arachis hypogaea TaxID=3818 RepID=A0A445EAI8_ARAHY|nr:hypothetical protein Ahy_A02g006763 isoform E [Arachis hypogaea]